MQSMFSDYGGIKLEITKRNLENSQICGNNEWVREEITREIRKGFEVNENEN